MDAAFTTITTPVGPFTVVVDCDGAVLASGWTATACDLIPLVHPTLRPTGARPRDELGEVSKAVAAYHAGDVDALGDVPVRQVSSPFISHAWEVLRAVPAGRPVTYTEFALLASRPAAVRAAASACARNAAALFVPCHRVLRTGGGLGGFRWGTDVKAWLLDHEATSRRHDTEWLDAHPLRAAASPG
jgi:methylated-DNA-[protein]-cysteine S-methyltransferase